MISAKLVLEELRMSEDSITMTGSSLYSSLTEEGWLDLCFDWVIWMDFESRLDQSWQILEKTSIFHHFVLAWTGWMKSIKNLQVYWCSLAFELQEMAGFLLWKEWARHSDSPTSGCSVLLRRDFWRLHLCCDDSKVYELLLGLFELLNWFCSAGFGTAGSQGSESGPLVFLEHVDGKPPARFERMGPWIILRIASSFLF